jgi:hypothetical protein
MNGASHAAVQAALEDRFRQFLIDEQADVPGSLQITWTCSLPEGPGSFAIYRTEYRTHFEAPEPAAAPAAQARRSAEIIPFPCR